MGLTSPGGEGEGGREGGKEGEREGKRERERLLKKEKKIRCDTIRIKLKKLQ